VKDFLSQGTEKAGMKSQQKEELKGRGNLYHGNTLICDVTYEVYVFQEFIDKGPNKTAEPSLKACYGFIYGPGIFFDSLGEEVTLHLEDERYLDCVLEDCRRGRLEITCNRLYR
jgi:hypothetical protein